MALEPSHPLPQHIAVIMDGNGRWAKKRLMPRTAGHKVGAGRVRDMVMLAHDLKIPSLTLYSFSTENWARPETEVSFLFNLLSSALMRELDALHARNIRIGFLGNLKALPEKTQALIETVQAKTLNNTGLRLNIAFNYGGRWDILHATQCLAQQVQSGLLSPENITESLFEDHLSTHHQPEVDLLIRTGGEHRISNFMLWQLSYAELYFTDVLFPEFTLTHFQAALEFFQQQERRKGQTSDQLK